MSLFALVVLLLISAGVITLVATPEPETVRKPQSKTRRKNVRRKTRNK